MPAKVFERPRLTVTAGLAKLVDEVKEYAAETYAPTANGVTPTLPDRNTPKTTRAKPNVATTSPSQSPPPPIQGPSGLSRDAAMPEPILSI